MGLSEAILSGEITRTKALERVRISYDALVTRLEEVSPSEHEAISYLIDRYETVIGVCAY